MGLTIGDARFYGVVGNQGSPTEADTIGIMRGAGALDAAMANAEHERIADRVAAITTKHGEKCPTAVEELLELLRSAGWHLELHVEEEGMRYWSIEEGAHPNTHR